MRKIMFGLFVILILPCMFTILSQAQEEKVENEYSIVIINNGEEVPLAAEMSSQPVVFSAMLPLVFLFVVVTIISSLYIMHCYKYRERIKTLFKKDNRAGKTEKKVSWNLFQLKDLENELENYLASSIRIN